MSDGIDDPPGIVRLVPGTLALTDMTDQAEAALASGSCVWIVLTSDDRRPFFALRSARGSVQVIDGDGRHLGTFADVMVAMVHGWARGAET